MATIYHSKRRTTLPPNSLPSLRENSTTTLNRTPAEESDPLKNAIKFSSQLDLFSLDLEAHAQRIANSLTEKEQIIDILRTGLIENAEVNCLHYRSASFTPFLESGWIQHITPFSLRSLDNITIAAIDGGLGFRQFFGLQLTLVKAAVVIYHLHGSNAPTIENYPAQLNPKSYCFYTDFAPSTEFHGTLLAGYRRAAAENYLLLRYLQTTPTIPAIVILDGSLCPPSLPIAAQDEELTAKYYQLCRLSYLKLFETAKKRGIILVGCVKDSRSTVLRDLLIKAMPSFISKYPALEPLQSISYRQILKGFTDAELVYKLLPTCTRTLAFRFDSKFDSSPPSCSLAPESTRTGQIAAPQGAFTPNCNPQGNNSGDATEIQPIIATYLQISPTDAPLRIEFLSPENLSDLPHRVNMVVNTLYPLSNITPQSTLPIMQVEAHMQAHLSETEMDLMNVQLHQKLSLKQLLDITRNTKNDSMQYWNEKPGGETTFDLPLKSYFGTFLGRRHDRLPF